MSLMDPSPVSGNEYEAGFLAMRDTAISLVAKDKALSLVLRLRPCPCS